jgi:hypothetical protein
LPVIKNGRSSGGLKNVEEIKHQVHCRKSADTTCISVLRDVLEDPSRITPLYGGKVLGVSLLDYLEIFGGKRRFFAECHATVSHVNPRKKKKRLAPAKD